MNVQDVVEAPQLEKYESNRVLSGGRGEHDKVIEKIQPRLS